jgi:hypothetical protein
LFTIFKITAWSLVLLERLRVSHLLRNSTPFTEPEGSLSGSQEPATCPCAEPYESVHTLLP